MNPLNSNRVAEGVTATPFELSLKPNVRKRKKRTSKIAKRDVMKTGTYAVMHFCVAVLVAFALTQDIRIALSIGLIEPVVQTFAYTLHELGWSRSSKEEVSATNA
ncbi:MAG: DUF2061 domain-containing protein [Pseudomonadota bacterium]